MFSVKSAQNSPEFARRILDLGIGGVGKAKAAQIAQAFNGFKELKRALVEQHEKDELPGLGLSNSSKDEGKKNQAVVKFFDSDHNRELAWSLYEVIMPQAVKDKSKAGRALPFEGQTVVLTGSLTSMTRQEGEELVRALGGKSAKSVSRNTGLLVAGPGAGSKLAKARELGVSVIDEAEFRKRAGLEPIT